MKNILITGATGNVGAAVIKHLQHQEQPVQVFAGVRNMVSAKEKFRDYKALEYLQFDFEQPGTFKTAFKNIDTVFLLRPPHISDVEKYFRPLVSAMKENQVGEIVFLSVQGAEKSKVIPHHKIEKLIEEYGLDHIFLRPAYFMQNLTTTLLPDIQSKKKIILPAGKGKFNWSDNDCPEVFIHLIWGDNCAWPGFPDLTANCWFKID